MCAFNELGSVKIPLPKGTVLFSGLDTETI
jgi:hypothetical protein